MALTPGRALRPGEVIRARAVTRFAGNVELRPRRVERVAARVVALPEIRRMALGALEVPRLAVARPVQRIAGLDVLIGIEMKPARAPLRLGPRIPRDAERLHAPAGKLDQILLQRTNAERVLDLVVVKLAVRAVGVDEELSVAAEERRRRPRVLEFRVGEIAEDRLVVGGLHRQIVVRAAPGLGLLRVAPGARAAPDVFGGRRLDCHRLSRRTHALNRRAVRLIEERARGDEERSDRRCGDAPSSPLRRGCRLLAADPEAAHSTPWRCRLDLLRRCFASCVSPSRVVDLIQSVSATVLDGACVRRIPARRRRGEDIRIGISRCRLQADDAFLCIVPVRVLQSLAFARSDRAYTRPQRVSCAFSKLVKFAHVVHRRTNPLPVLPSHSCRRSQNESARGFARSLSRWPSLPPPPPLTRLQAARSARAPTPSCSATALSAPLRRPTRR